ncbi:MAG TPA: hypothetical protein VHI96_08225 [Solirubrobacterales bacterium]|jgi:hypothetical protein|nr:hypothetical protein [Solirubrobacterales bacterium]
MGLQGDQRALLQLLSERGQSYEDIAGLLGGTADEVRERARAALAEIGGSDPDADVALTDFLLGQADPIGRADAIRHLQSDSEALDLARKIQTGLAVIAPDARQPNLPEPRGKRRKAALPDATAAPAPDAAPPADPDAAAARRRRSVIAGLAALGLLLVVAVLALAGVFSGSDSDSTTSTAADTSTTADSNITTVPLRPVGGSGVAGKAIFGLVSNQQLYVDVDVQGLDPNLDTGKSYLLWLMVGDSAGYPIDRLEADDNGSFSGRLSVPTPIAVAVGNQAQSVRVSATSVRALQSEIKQATQQKVPILPFTGDQLATGDIPLVGGRQGSGRGQG